MANLYIHIYIVNKNSFLSSAIFLTLDFLAIFKWILIQKEPIEMYRYLEVYKMYKIYM